MPKVTIEYDLPAEQEALESALMGAEAAQGLEAFRTWLVTEVAAQARDPSQAQYLRGIERARAELDRLLAAVQPGSVAARSELEADEA